MPLMLMIFLLCVEMFQIVGAGEHRRSFGIASSVSSIANMHVIALPIIR